MEIKLKKEDLKPSSITLFLLKLSSNADEISILDTLNVLAYKKLAEKNIINRRFKNKYIYSFCNLKNLFIICILYNNEKTKIYL
jgi:hypothetical protein